MPRVAVRMGRVCLTLCYQCGNSKARFRMLYSIDNKFGFIHGLLCRVLSICICIDRTSKCDTTLQNTEKCVRHSALQNKAVQCSIEQRSAVQCGAEQCSAVQCSAVQYSALQCGAKQSSTVQCSAEQCSAVSGRTKRRKEGRMHLLLASITLHCGSLLPSALHCNALH